MSFEIPAASLSSVRQHFESGREVGIITAFRETLSLSKNIARNKSLSSRVRNAGYGFFYLDSAFIENEGTSGEALVNEVSLFIVGNEEPKGLRRLLIEWVREFGQDTTVYKKPEGEVFILNKQGGADISFLNVDLDKTFEVFTRLRHGNHAGQPIHFSSLTAREPQGWISRLSYLSPLEN